jgi:hypothetical protein
MAAEQLNDAGIAERLRIAIVNGTRVARRYGFVRAEFGRDRGYERLGHRPRYPDFAGSRPGRSPPRPAQATRCKKLRPVERGLHWAASNR